MCTSQTPDPPRAPGAPPAAPLETARILRPSKARSRRKGGEDVLSKLRIPLTPIGPTPETT